MPAINDYKCTVCGYIDRDCIVKPDFCPSCENPMEVTFQNWRNIEFDAYHNARTDQNGAIKAFGALEDPLCRAQLGLTTDPQLASYGRLSPEQAEEFRGRILKDGDSGKLRKDVLEAYSKAIGKYEVQRD